MAQENPYLNQLEQRINLLIAENNIKAAYELCKQVLLKVPNEKRFISLKKDIESKIEKENKKLIETKIKESEPLIETGKYVEVLISLKPFMESYQTPKLIKFYEKVAELYGKQKKQEEEAKIKELKKKFAYLLKNNHDEKILQEIIILEKNNSGNLELQKFIREYKTKIIDKRIKEKTELIHSDKYIAITNLLNELKKIDNNSEIIFKLEKDLKDRMNFKQIQGKNDFISNGKNYIETLINLKKYDKAIKVAEELLEIDKNNKSILKMLKKADKKLFRETRDTSVAAIETNKDTLKNEYKNNKDKFIKI